MNKLLILSLATVAISLIGMIDSGYVTYQSLLNVVPTCGEGFDCGTVLSSDWAYLGLIPVSGLGFLFYTTVFILGIFKFLEVKTDYVQTIAGDLLHTNTGKFLVGLLPNATRTITIRTVETITWQTLLLLLTGMGFLFTLYLVFLMAFVIDAWCLFCIISAASSTSLFIIQLLSVHVSTRVTQ